MRKGGYEIINLNDLPLSTSETSTSVELYEKLLKSSKVVLISSLNVDEKVYNDCFMFVDKKTDEIVLKNSAYIITVEDDGTITTAENTVVIPEITYETIYDFLETEKVEDENLMIIAKDTVNEKVDIYPNLSIIQKKLKSSNIEDGTISKLIGFDTQGDIVKQNASSGAETQLYKHTLVVEYEEEHETKTGTIILFNNINTQITSISSNIIDKTYKVIYMAYNGYVYYEATAINIGIGVDVIDFSYFDSNGTYSIFVADRIVSDTVTQL